MTEQTGTFGEYGHGKFYFTVHSGSDHQTNRYPTRLEAETARRESLAKNPADKITQVYGPRE